MRTGRIVAIIGIFACGTVAALAEQREGPPPAPPVLEKLDANLDGTVTRDEFEAADAFDALDVNQDGVLTRADFPPPTFKRMSGHLVKMADADRDGNVTSAEWNQFLASADPDGNGIAREQPWKPSRRSVSGLSRVAGPGCAGMGRRTGTRGHRS